ncbi:hypothetical protein NZ698_13520 [Chryseobacterium sp. PBS4-4]|uniref:Uncharacterized protein n=1 Tax=Chryseobacterium edaphi TaxID=2976532 RepID=A0ABT2W7N4_9FLAO|nr:hypothetical protein [Chryseobacterium edaphi]MCU7618223.1 hypothetical protein [Chryseobacterium edaphi]
MKKFIVIFSLLIVNSAIAQIAIGKSSVTTIPPANTVVNPSISLEFGVDGGASLGRGVVLPWITAVMDKAAAVPGTIIFDTVDKTVKYKNGSTAGSWFSLSKNETVPVIGDTTGVVDTSLQDPFTDNPDAKVSIGTPATSPVVPGILVLENNNQAMVLPKVASPHLNVLNPEPGTMVYDTTKKQLAIFNGKVWSFWNPQP